MRWNLKEAEGKALARRTETIYEAAMLDEKASLFKVQYLYRNMEVDVAGISVKVDESYPGRSHRLPVGLPWLRGNRKGGEKSAEGIVGRTRQAEGPNMKNVVRRLEFR